MTLMEGTLAEDSSSANKTCFNVWDQSNLGVEICFFIMSLLFIVQAVYAGLRKARLAIQFDVVMAFGCSISLGIWLGLDWLVQV